MTISYLSYKEAGLRSSSIDIFSDIDLTVQPEALEIQLDAPSAGHGASWLWTWVTSSLPYARTTITNAAQLSVPLYKQGTYQINNFANSLHSEMTQTHQFKLKWVEGAGDDNLITDWVTYSTASHSHPSINGGSNLTVQRLAVNVPSVVTPPTLVAPSVSYAVATTIGAYVFSGTNMGNNIQLGPMYRGGTYTFNLTATGHPFYLTTDNGTGFVTQTYVGEYTSGVTGSRNETGTLVFVVPQDAPNVLYYQCGVHGNMRGTIVIKDLAVTTNENGNYIIYGQHSQEAHAQAMEIRPIPTLTSQMCIVYDAVNSKFVPQDLATYVENTPAFRNKIQEVAGTATLIAPDGTSLVASVQIYTEESYLPQVGNVIGDIAFSTDTEKLYIWNVTGWVEAAAKSATNAIALNQAGILAVTTGTVRWYAPAALTVNSIVARLGTAADATVTAVAKKNGVTAATTSITAGQTTATNNTGFSMAIGDYLTLDVTAIGSASKGADLNVQFLYTFN